MSRYKREEKFQLLSFLLAWVVSPVLGYGGLRACGTLSHSLWRARKPYRCPDMLKLHSFTTAFCYASPLRQPAQTVGLRLQTSDGKREKQTCRSSEVGNLRFKGPPERADRAPCFPS